MSDPADLEPLQLLYEHSDGPSCSFLQGLVDQSHCQAWCLVKDNQPVAAIWYQCVAERAEMVDLRVLASERRQGLGRQLLWASLAALGDVGAVELEVRSSNVAARALYGGHSISRWVSVRRACDPSTTPPLTAVRMRY